MTFPYKWQPDIVDTVVAFVGNLGIAGMPGELTTMAGRRMRATMRDVMAEQGVASPKAVIAGLTNVYSDYITTFEEYQVIRVHRSSPYQSSYQLCTLTDLMPYTSMDYGHKDKEIIMDGSLLLSGFAGIHPFEINC
jgi:neutral ceramidase